MDINTFVPYVRDVTRGKSMTTRRDTITAPDSSLLYITGGSGTAWVDGMEYKIATSSFILLPAGTPYSLMVKDSTEPLHYLLVLFHYSQGKSGRTPLSSLSLSEFDWDSSIDICPVADFASPLIVQHLDVLSERMNELFAENAGKATLYGAEGRLSAMLKDILIFALRATNLQQNSKNTLAKDVICYIDAHIDEPITNETIAAAFGYHPYYLTRILRQELGMTPHKYLMQKRCETAKSLLLTSDSTIESIAQQVGFSSQSHFAAAFRVLTGVTPTEFRRRTTKKESTATNA